METRVSKGGRITIPAAIRKRYGVKAGDSIAWIDHGMTISVVPLPSDPVEALHGAGRGEGLVEKLLDERRKDRQREERRRIP